MAEPGRSYLVSTACYQDAKAALRWLEDAFGFEPSLVVLDDTGLLLHSEMRFGESIFMVGSESPPLARSPRNVGGTNTQKVHVQLASGIDEHCERARKAGARITREPRTEAYGDRTYVCEDPEGHVWSFGETVQMMSREQWNEMPGVHARTRI